MANRPLIAGETIATAGRTIGEGDITLFAGLAGDFTPIHMDAAFAETTPFGERIAHGPLTMSAAIGLLTQTGLLGERVIALVNLNWDFSGPVRIGDTIRAKVTVQEIRPTSKEGRNLVTFLLDVANQHGESVQTGHMRVVVKTD